MKTAAPAEFDEHILRIVDEFLQTVVVVDDRALDHDDLGQATDVGEEESAGGGRERGVQPGLRAPTEPDAHDLDPKVVTDAFAEDGLVCSLLSPGPDEDVDEKFVRTARRADLVVMDWVLHRDEGRKTLKLIEQILADEERPDRRRLRTIAVYTGQSDLHDIADRLATALDAVYTDCDLERQDDGLTMTKGPVRAAVFAKEHVSELAGGLEARRVAFADLPGRLRAEFATLTTGLITGVALAALAALRDDTHRILRTLGPGLDPAYLGHRAALPDADEAEDQAVSLVAAEIYSVIQDNDVGRNVQLPVLKLWLTDARRGDLRFGELINPNKRLSLPQVEMILSCGLGTDEGSERVGEIRHGKNYFKKTVKRQATKVFCSNKSHAEESDADFAHRTMMRTAYARPPRVLQLGTIVHSEGEYRLCVQPVCDSVRLTEPRAFPFLPLTSVDVDGNPDFVVANHEGSGWIRLSLGGNPSDLDMVSFDPGPNSSVIASVEDDAHSFTDDSGVSHRWIGELKPDFGQRVAFDLAQQFARVAVDEAEILRLSRR